MFSGIPISSLAGQSVISVALAQYVLFDTILFVIFFGLNFNQKYRFEWAVTFSVALQTSTANIFYQLEYLDRMWSAL